MMIATATYLNLPIRICRGRYPLPVTVLNDSIRLVSREYHQTKNTASTTKTTPRALAMP